jgi:hypothetical protein
VLKMIMINMELLKKKKTKQQRAIYMMQVWLIKREDLEQRSESKVQLMIAQAMKIQWNQMTKRMIKGKS